MHRIAWCESRKRQFHQGQPLISRTDDIGLFQIHRPTWEKKAEEMGIDIYTVEGNIKMARHIKRVQGLSAWVCYGIIKKT